MGWTFNDIHYGWKIAAGITLAGTTIYVASNQRQRINQADMIEIVVGVHERCLATATGAGTYGVAPPSYVREWQDTNGTVTVTNTIGWRVDRDMLVETDEKIKALIPYYVNTNTLFDGTTNISMLTITGLWASLDIGDGTNLFLSVPAKGTNAAVYGEYSQRIYVECLEERYKILNYLQVTDRGLPNWCDIYYNEGPSQEWSWEAAKTSASNLYLSGYFESSLTNYSLGTNIQATVNIFSKSSGGEVSGAAYYAYLYGQALTLGLKTYSPVLYICDFYIKSLDINWATQIYNEQGSGLSESIPWTFLERSGLASNVFISTTNYGSYSTLPIWCDEPTTNDIDNATFLGYAFEVKSIVYWQFQYCTNRYW